MMGKLLRSFQKRQSIASRIRCFLLALAMVVTMVPAFGGGSRTVQAAQGEKNLTIHFMMPSNWGWTTPAMQFWGGTAAVTGNTNGENGEQIEGWDQGVMGYSMTKVESGSTEIEEYTLSVKGTFTGFQFLDLKSPSYSAQTSDAGKMTQYTGEEATDIYFLWDSEEYVAYVNKEGTEKVPELSEAPVITIYFDNPDGWTQPAFNAWGADVKIDNNNAGQTMVKAWNQNHDKMALDTETNLYYVKVQAVTLSGLQIINSEADSQELHLAEAGVLAAINDITTDTSIYYLRDGKGGMKWYKYADKSETLIEYKEAGYVSPEVNGREVTFRVPVEKTGAVASVTVPGGMNGWKQDSSDWELKKDETAGMWSGTFTIAPGKYEYKFALNKTWDVSFSDPANNRVSGTNSVLIVPGLVDGEANATKANETALPEILTLWNEDGTSSETAVTYSLKTPDQNITLNGNKIKIGNGYTGQNVELTAEAENGQTSDFVVHVKEKIILIPFIITILTRRICQKMHLTYGFGRKMVLERQKEHLLLRQKHFRMEMNGCVQK